MGKVNKYMNLAVKRVEVSIPEMLRVFP